MKGMSEIITVVLLTAMAVAGGVFITIWYRQSAEKQTEIFEQYATEEECKSVMFEVLFSPTECKASVYNAGQVKIGKIKADYYYLDGKHSSETLGEAMPKASLQLSDEKLNNLEKLQLIPIIITERGEQACQNERIFPPTEEFRSRCP